MLILFLGDFSSLVAICLVCDESTSLICCVFLDVEDVRTFLIPFFKPV